MKRYEKMSKEEIIDYMCSFESCCFACPYNEANRCNEDCGKLWKEWFYEEVEEE